MTTTLSRPAAGVLETPEIRVDGRDKVNGRMQYTADVHRPGMLWAAFATSPYAHAKILRIDTSAAKQVPGVRAVLTAADVGYRRFGRQLCDWPVLAWDRVLLIGDRVAAVAAETREAAEAAARLVEVEYGELEPVLDPFAALAEGAPVLHPDRSSYVHVAFAGKDPMVLPHPNVQGWARIRRGDGDLDAIFDGAHRVYELRFTTARQHAGYLEPHATLVWIDGDGTVHVQSPNKTPFPLRAQLARCKGVPAEKIVIEPAAIGGDFGGKGLTIDEFPVFFLAQATGRPVRYVQSYAEELTVAATRHAGYITLRTAVDDQGRFLAHSSTVIYDGGAYAAGKPNPKVTPGNGYSTVPYDIAAVRADTTVVYTNTQPAAHVRAPNDLQIFFAWEQHVDAIARDLGIDPVALRRRNIVDGDKQAVTGERMHDPQGHRVLDALERELASRPTLASGRGRGISLVCRHTGGGKTSLLLRAYADGRLEIVTGVTEQGGGQLTVANRVAAATLGIDPAKISVRRAPTAEALTDPGTGGSRVTHIVGRAAQLAAEQLLALVAERAGLELRAGGFVDANGTAVAWEAAAARACADGPLDAIGAYDATHADPHHAGDFTFSAFVIEVDVDRETGGLRVADALMITDVGQIINPIAHQGQIDGGFITGLGCSLMEEITRDESGKVQTPSLGEYKLPTIADIPPFRTILLHGASGEGPFGAKMAGELSNTGVAPAIANAVFDACGVRLDAFPFTAERVHDALNPDEAEFSPAG